MPEGCDISEHQGDLAPEWFNQFAFVIVRAYNENDVRDEKFDQNWTNAKGRTRRGIYGWPVPGADNYTYGRQLAALGADAELLCWADLEMSTAQGLASPDDLEQYLRGIESMGAGAGFYSGIGNLYRSTYLDATPWWLSHYGVNDGNRNPIVRPSPPDDRPWVMHQYTSNPLDLNYAPSLDFAGQPGGFLMALTDQQQMDVWNTCRGLAVGVNPGDPNVLLDVTARLERIEAQDGGGAGGGPSEAQIRAIVAEELANWDRR